MVEEEAEGVVEVGGCFCNARRHQPSLTTIALTPVAFVIVLLNCVSIKGKVARPTGVVTSSMSPLDSRHALISQGWVGASQVRIATKQLQCPNMIYLVTLVGEFERYARGTTEQRVYGSPFALFER